jgi:large subunit ribosomal protein L21
MYAVIQTGGKQYRVAEGDRIKVEKLDAENGSVVPIDVKLIANGSELTTDGEALANAKVFAEVVDQIKGDKALVFKFKKRKGYKRLRGHRQDLTVLDVVSISADGTAPKGSK